MGEIILKIPRKKRKVTIIRDQERLEREISVIDDYYRKIIGEMPVDSSKKTVEPENQELLKKTPKKVKKVIFTQTFTISNSNQPVKIDLGSIPEEQISLEDAKIEVQNAYDKGFSDGQEASNAAYQNEIDAYKDWIRNIDSVVRNLRSNYIHELTKLEAAVSELSLTIASHIIDREASSDSQVVIKQVQRAIAILDDEDIFKILVNPQDFEVLIKVKSELISDKSRMDKVVISQDSSVERGGCVLITSAGTIDAKISTQLKKLYNELSDVVEQGYNPKVSLSENQDTQNEPDILQNKVLEL